jgi:hypothetical protein
MSKKCKKFTLKITIYKTLLQLAISQSPGSSRANPMLEGQEIWQHTFKLKV